MSSCYPSLPSHSRCPIFNKTGIYTVSLTCYFLHFPLHLLNYLSSRITLTHLSISCLYIVTRVLIISKRSPYMTFISPWVGTSTRSIPPETKHGDMTNYTPVKITTYSCTPGTTVRELEINPLFRLAYPFADEVTVLIFELVLKIKHGHIAFCARAGQHWRRHISHKVLWYCVYLT